MMLLRLQVSAQICSNNSLSFITGMLDAYTVSYRVTSRIKFHLDRFRIVDVKHLPHFKMPTVLAQSYLLFDHLDLNMHSQTNSFFNFQGPDDRLTIETHELFIKSYTN